MQTAAVALNLGWADPMALLDAPEDDYLVAAAVVQQAAKDRAEREKSLLENLTVVVQNGVARAFGGK